MRIRNWRLLRSRQQRRAGSLLVRNACIQDTRSKATMKTIEIPVLIAGGGPVGLCASILLSHHGVPSLLVERHTGTSLYPKARLVNARTMEIFRQCGLEQAVRDISLPPEQSRHAIWARTLVGEELQRRTIVTVTPDLSAGVSPTFGCTTSQEVLEPVLLRCARQFNLGQVRFSSELTTFIQDGSGISATLLDREQGEQTQGAGAVPARGRRGAQPRARGARHPDGRASWPGPHDEHSLPDRSLPLGRRSFHQFRRYPASRCARDTPADRRGASLGLPGLLFSRCRAMRRGF